MITTTFNDLIEAISNAGGVPVLVGGGVRDMVMAGLTTPDLAYSQDVDIEVFGLTLPRLQDALSSKFFRWDEVGEHFSVLKVNVLGFDNPVDLSIPRYEASTGDGHREFQVMADPDLTFKEAARRRDFTINSMGYNLLTGELLDPYYGARDIERFTLRHVSDAFAEDPLRPLRAARFAARFGLAVLHETAELCREMRPLADSLPSERIWAEIEKAIHECKRLGRFFWWLYDFGWIDIFPEVAALRWVEQDPEWHPEGNVFIHTVAALDYWSQNLRTGNKEDDLIVATATLCHDFGKATTTEFIDGRIRARGHEEAGVDIARSFLHRLRQYELANDVAPLIANHLAPVRPFTKRSIRRLTTKVDRMDLLCLVSRADTAGRPPLDPTGSFPEIEEFEQAWRGLDVPIGGPKPLVGGDYLIKMGMKPGPAFKTVLDDVYEKQLDGEVTTIEEAHERARFVINEWGLN